MPALLNGLDLFAAARAEKLWEKLVQEAKERQRSSGGDRKSIAARSVQEDLPEPISTKTQARDELGKLFGVTGRLIDHATKVLAKGEPELVKAVDDGRIGVSRFLADSSRRRAAFESGRR